MQRAVAQACANIALIKYWGKRGALNVPATPSIGLCLESLSTTTSVERNDAGADSVRLDGAPAAAGAYQRVADYIGLWRQAGLVAGHFNVDSQNDFPTAAGLASSSSGFAALALGLSAFCTTRFSTAQLSRLARWGSGSAARSIHGGITTLPVADDPAARQLLAVKRTPLAMALCVVQAGSKDVGSREGMQHCAASSPYYGAWLKQARQDYVSATALLSEARGGGGVELGDAELAQLGPVVEANCLAMHACMLGARPPLYYWAPGTLAVLAAVRQWRADGLSAYFTIDAGPHVALLCLKRDLDSIAAQAARIPGVLRVIRSRVGAAARFIERK